MIPEASHLQVLVLSFLSDVVGSGREIRNFIAKHGQLKTNPAFYQMMARMESSGYVVGHYDKKIIEKQIIKERFYEITESGQFALKNVREFYLSL